MKKKLFSLFLAICMMISLLPVTASADEDEHVAENEAEYDAFVPGAGKYMIELIFSYNGDFNGNLLGGFELCENPDRPEYSNPDDYITYSNEYGVKTKMIFTKPNSDNMYNAAYFRFYPSYGCKISGIAQGTQVFGDVYNLPVGQFTTQETYEQLYVRLNDDGSFSTSVGIRAGNYENRQQLYISFKMADPSEIPNAPTNPVWYGTTAKWDAVDGVDKYLVNLCECIQDPESGASFIRLDSKIVDNNSTSYDFTTNLNKLPSNKSYCFYVNSIKNKVCSNINNISGIRGGLHTTHSSTAGWKYDGEYHWKECDTCHEEFEKATHSPSTGACSTCNITPITIINFWLWFKPTLGGTPATTEILYCGWMDNVNVLDHQLNSNNMKWYKMAANQYTGPSADGSTTGWTEMGADEQFVTGFMYRVDVNYNKVAGVSYFKNEDTNYYVKDDVKNVKCVSTLFILNDVIRLSGYFSPISAPVTPPVTPPSRPSREPDPEPTYLPYISDDEMTWDEVCKYLKTLNNGDEVDIHLGGADVVPEKVMTVIADKKLKVNFIYSYAKSWFVDGAKIDSPAETNLAISAKTSPDTSELRGIVGTSFEVFGANFPVEQTISFKTEHAGKFANLYKIEDDKPVFVAAVRIDEDGKAKFADMSAEGEYVIMIGEYSDLSGDMDNNGIVNVNDALAVLKRSLGILNGENPYVADVNNDGAISITDALLILKASIAG